MKKALALLVVLAILAMPVFAMAGVQGSYSDTIGGGPELPAGKVSTTGTSFYMLPDDAEVDVEDGAVDLPPIIIPAAGAVAAAGVAMVLATLGVALLPKK